MNRLIFLFLITVSSLPRAIAQSPTVPQWDPAMTSVAVKQLGPKNQSAMVFGGAFTTGLDSWLLKSIENPSLRSISYNAAEAVLPETMLPLLSRSTDIFLAKALEPAIILVLNQMFSSRDAQAATLGTPYKSMKGLRRFFQKPLDQQLWILKYDQAFAYWLADLAHRLDKALGHIVQVRCSENRIRANMRLDWLHDMTDEVTFHADGTEDLLSITDERTGIHDDIEFTSAHEVFVTLYLPKAERMSFDQAILWTDDVSVDAGARVLQKRILLSVLAYTEKKGQLLDRCPLIPRISKTAN